MASLHRQAGWADRLMIGPGLLIASLALVAGWLSPLMTIRTLLILSEPVSLLDGLETLLEAERYGLFAILFLFAMLFPLLKLLFAAWLWFRSDTNSPLLRKHLDILEGLGRWAMLDVFIVAQTVTAIQISLVADVELHPGLYIFTGAILLSMALLMRMTALAGRAGT